MRLRRGNPSRQQLNATFGRQQDLRLLDRALEVGVEHTYSLTRHLPLSTLPA